MVKYRHFRKECGNIRRSDKAFLADGIAAFGHRCRSITARLSLLGRADEVIE